MDALDRKINEVFPGKVVRKDLTALLRRGANVPTFVLEYLLGMYCATDDETAIAEGVEKIRKILAENYVRPEESEKVKSLIRERGEYTVIDKVSAVLDEYKDIYVARFSNLEIEPFVLQSDYAVKYTKILMGGIWCIARIGYTYQQDSMEDEKKRRKKRGPEDSPFRILGLKPIQLPNLDAAEMIDKRKEFTTEEWIAMLLRSEGMEPDALSEKEKLHFIERMVPLAEHNYNLCELGPRGTGKSHLYKEISPYSILMSGGQTTTANLFYSMSAHRVGLVGHWDCVAFDEVAGMRFRDLDAIQIMKDYMASGSFARGRDMINADASMVFVGNINDSVQNLLKVAHLFEPFPPEFNNDSAFFDRIHYYLPGWEIPKMRSELLTEKYGLITDCLAELTRELRKKDCTHLLDAYFRTFGVQMKPQLEFRCDFPAGDTTVSVDPLRLQQVVTNFLSNANKFTAAGSVVLGYRIAADRSEVRIFVKDTGKGIPSEELKLIFSRFYKHDEFAQGTGLGLSICQSIVERMHGRIEVESQEGGGSCFTVVLPLT